MLQTLQLIGSTNPKRADNIIANSRVIERKGKLLCFILNSNKNNLNN